MRKFKDKNVSNEKNEMKEYESLRNEIMQKIELHNTLITFTITGTLAVLAIAFNTNNTLLYLAPMCIIIPISIRVAYYLYAMSKLSAYIIVFIEDHITELKWESRNTFFSKYSKNSKIKRFVLMHYYEYLILSILCGSLYVYGCISSFTSWFVFILQMIIVVCLEICEIIITYYMNSAGKRKQDYIDIWKKVKANQEYLHICDE